MSVRSTGAPPSLPRPAPFTTAIPLDGDRTLPRTFVAGPLSLTPGAVADGGRAVLPLVADGAGAVAFPGFTEYGGSAGYADVAGTLNLIQFFYLDGTPYYAVTQAVNAQPVYPPASAYALTGPATVAVGAAATFTARANGVLAAAVTLTLSDGGVGGAFAPAAVSLPAGPPTAVAFTYTPACAGPRTLRATNGGGLADPAGLALSAPETSDLPLRLTGLTGLSEAADGPGYAYTPTTGEGYDSGYAVSAVAIPAGRDGHMGATLSATGASGLIVGLKTGAAAGAYNSLAHGLYADPTISANYQVITGGRGGGAADAPVAAQAEDVVRVRRAGASVYGEVSKDGGRTYAVTKTWAGATDAALYGGFQSGNPGVAIRRPFTSAGGP